MQEAIQRFGRFLSAMVMPNIGAFIAWGFITALFIPAGWWPNEELAKLVGPMVTYLLPLLIGYTGGHVIYNVRGGVIGAIATCGIIVGAGIPMFIGAMIMGPLGGYLIKKFDENFQDKIPTGFEMLVNNFSAGIIGGFLAVLASVAIGPVVISLSELLRAGVEGIVASGFLPLVSIIVEPAKILFLNNAINHGVFSPIGIQEAQEAGKSIFFMIESNPGPGLGILLAYYFFGKGSAQSSASSAAIIHFFGGIHEIYFPYVLMNPMLILAVIAGGMSGVFTFTLFGAGLVAPPAPGSIIAYLAMTPKGNYFAVFAGVAVAAVVTFLVASIFVKRASANATDDQLESAKQAMSERKVQSKGGKIVAGKDIRKIIYACDAGMGSSAMGASSMRNKFKKAGYTQVSITNCAIENIPDDTQIVVAHEKLAERVMKKAPQAEHIFVKDFIQNNVFEILSARMKDVEPAGKTTAPAAPAAPAKKEEKKEEAASTLLRRENIRVGLKMKDKFEAIRMAGNMLKDSGYVDTPYVEGMVQREKDISTYIGEGIAIPHGISSVKNCIKKTGMVVLQFPEGLDFGGGNMAHLVIGIAAAGDEHLAILANIAGLIEDNAEAMKKLQTTDNPDEIYNFLVQ